MDKNIESLVKNGSVWFPESRSTLSSNVDLLYNVIFWGSTLIFVILLAIVIFFLVKYKRTKRNFKAKRQVTDNLKLELAWTIIPLFFLMAIFWWGFKDYLKLTIAPPDSMKIRVTAKKWLWKFEYPQYGVKLLNELVVPVDQPIKLIMSSEDVLHSFFIPNFRVKKDAVPNYYSSLWFEANKPGVYRIFCTEYCGDGHSVMGAQLRVLSREDFDDWVTSGLGTDDIPLDKLGEKLYSAKACNACHSLDGTMMSGPSWKNLYGKDRLLTDDSIVKADDNYLRESIVNPAAKIVSGYMPVMPSYAGLLNDREINALIEFIKSQNKGSEQ